MTSPVVNLVRFLDGFFFFLVFNVKHSILLGKFERLYANHPCGCYTISLDAKWVENVGRKSVSYHKNTLQIQLATIIL